jgi:DNA-binding MarR family transcriptional regulator
MTVDLPDDPISTFSRSIFTINGLLLDAGDSIAKPLNLSVAKWHVLGRANHKTRTVAEIARYIGVSRQGVQRIANALEEDGLIAFAAHDTDARTQVVRLTNKGRAALTQLYENDKQWSEGLLTRINNKELEQITKQLTKISETIATYSGGILDEA